jgi:hypothetical protein
MRQRKKISGIAYEMSMLIASITVLAAPIQDIGTENCGLMSTIRTDLGSTFL